MIAGPAAIFGVSLILALMASPDRCSISGLRFPHKVPKIFDLRSTDDKHIMAIDLATNSMTEAEIAEALKTSGASEVNKKDFED